MKITYKNITKYKKKTFKKRKTKNTVKKRKTKNTNKKRKITKGGTQEYDECPICTETLNKPPIKLPVITLSCTHKFHRNCIDKWCKMLALNSNNNDDARCSCPNCRTKFKSEDELKPPPKYTDIKAFGKYINLKLRDFTNKPREKLEDVLSSFLRTDSLPPKLLLDNAMEFVLVRSPKLDVPQEDWLRKYSFNGILDLDLEKLPPQENHSTEPEPNIIYFRFISKRDAEKSDDNNDEQDKIIAYQLDQVNI